MDILHEEWAQGIKVALKAYTRASDAYASNFTWSPALWALGIAAGLVLLEWLLSRHALRG